MKNYKILGYSLVVMFLTASNLWIGTEPISLFLFLFLTSIAFFSFAVYRIKKGVPVKQTPIRKEREKKRAAVQPVPEKEEEITVSEKEKQTEKEETRSLIFSVQLLLLSDDIEYSAQELIQNIKEVLEFQNGVGLLCELVEARESGRNQITATIKVEGDPDMLKVAKSWLTASIEEEWAGKEEISLKEIYN